MSRELDAFLIKNLDVCTQLENALAETEKRFWAHLGNTVVGLWRDVLKSAGGEWTIEFDSKERACYAFFDAWALDIKDEKRDYDRTPGLWFPELRRYKMNDLFNPSGSGRVYAEVWGTPLSRYAGDLAPVLRRWRAGVGRALESRGWKFYNDTTGRAEGDWGHRFPIVLKPEQVAKWIETGRPGSIFKQLEKAAEDFGAISPNLSNLVEAVRQKRRSR